MRLKLDSSSWKASSLQRRDFRHTADGPDPDAQPHADNIYEDPTQVRAIPKRKKDTKRWCKGVQGREHKVEVREGIVYGTWASMGESACTDHQYSFLGKNYTCYHVRKCVECGKIIQEWLPRELCPDAS